MKSIALTLAATLMTWLVPVQALAGLGPQDRDLAAVMKVVKRPGAQTPSASATRSNRRASAQSQQNRYLKMEMGGPQSEELTISVPLALVELLASFDEDASLQDIGGDGDVKLEDLVKALRDLGPSELLEIRGDEGWFRVWVE